jgi:hypothetical protein
MLPARRACFSAPVPLPKTRPPGSVVGLVARGAALGLLNFGAGIGTSLLQRAIREKILDDISKLPKPSVDRRGASEFLKDPATGSAVRLLDVLGKDLKPFTTDLQRQHEKIIAVARIQLAATVLLSDKTTADMEKKFGQLASVAGQLADYDEQLSTVQSNLDALLSLESGAMQTKAASRATPHCRQTG